jgi:glutamate synthase (NADPH/NADH) small chain
MSKFNMSLNKVPMPEQEPKVRAKNFLEVTLGYTLEQAIEEAKRCLQCKNPKCVGSCPVNINIPKFIAEIAEGNIEKAYEIISEDTLFPSICGRVCPQENQCEGDCIRAIKGESVAIGRLERFVGDYIRDNKLNTSAKIEKNGKKVAVIGSGPAGLACASELAKAFWKK